MPLNHKLWPRLIQLRTRELRLGPNNQISFNNTEAPEHWTRVLTRNDELKEQFNDLYGAEPRMPCFVLTDPATLPKLFIAIGQATNRYHSI
jgi:hypothetical protein